MIVYFTGTGNSRYAAEAFAAGLDDEITDAGALIRAGEHAALHSDKPWVFSCPTYAWQIPRLFADFIRQGTFTGCRDAYFIMTCGGDTGRAWERIARLCAECGFAYRGLLPVVMPENYVVMFAVPGAEEAQRIVAAAGPVLASGIAAVGAGKPFPPVGGGLMARLKTDLVNPLFYRFCITARPFHATDACISCGLCEKVCPLHNVRLRDGKPAWGRDCTHCMACISFCPEGAIEYGKKSRGQPKVAPKS